MTGTGGARRAGRANKAGSATWWAALLLVVIAPAALLAHGDEIHSINAPRALSPWDLAVVGVLLIVGALYAVGALKLSRRRGSGRRFEPLAFALGWGALIVSILPPLDSLSLQFFSVHMIQHELMMLVGAPLLILGRPLQRCMAGLPDVLRHPAAATLQSGAVSSAWRILTAPLCAWALHGLAIWVWHMPALYDAAVGNEGIHTLQHAMFVGTSALFWWGMLYGRYGRAGYGAAVFYVFLTVVHTGILGAMVTFARTPLYAVYEAPAAAHGVDALVDQQRAGLLMWIPAGLVMTMLGLALFAAWLGESERRTMQMNNERFKMQTLPEGEAR
jgi:putative membrane protein